MHRESISKSSSRLLDVSKHIQPKLSFSKTLQSFTADHVLKTKHKFASVVKVPPSLCYKPRYRSPVMAASSILALFDDLNANPLIAYDKSIRSGVSVFLSTQILTPVGTNEKVKFNFTIDKIGKLLGFCSMTMTSEDGNIIYAKGSHVKYMPRNYFVDNLLMPFIYTMIPLLDWLSTNISFLSFLSLENIFLWYVKPPYHKYKQPVIEVDSDVIHASFDSFQLQPYQSELHSKLFNIYTKSTSDSNNSHNNNNNNNNSNNNSSDNNNSVNSTDMITYIFEVKLHMLNLMGGLHGGCIGMMIEEALRLYYCRDKIDCIIHTIDLKFLTPIKKYGIIHVPTTLQSIPTSSSSLNIWKSSMNNSALNNSSTNATYIKTVITPKTSHTIHTIDEITTSTLYHLEGYVVSERNKISVQYSCTVSFITE